MIVRLPGIANVTLLQNGRILIELTHGYGYAYVVCQTCCLLYLQWITFSSILLSGDIEPNPGPNTSMFSFCSWNLNSICAHDFVRIPLIEAYNSVSVSVFSVSFHSTIILKTIQILQIQYIILNT